MKRKPYRQQFAVFRDNIGAWCFSKTDEKPWPVLVARAHKTDAVWLAANMLEEAWQQLRIRSELTIHDRKGRIQDKRTYGEDPRRTKG